MFTNEEVLIDQIPQFQNVHLHALHPEYKKIVLLNSTITFVVGLLLSIALFFIFDAENGRNTFFFIPLVVALIISGYHLASFSKKKFAFRQHDIMYHSGLLYKSTDVVPFIRVQHIVVKQGWFAKKLGLATIELHTAANDNQDVSIPGLTFEEANRWKAYVLNRIEFLEDESTD